jgi:hypothetical protein
MMSKCQKISEKSDNVERSWDVRQSQEYRATTSEVEVSDEVESVGQGRVKSKCQTKLERLDN